MAATGGLHRPMNRVAEGPGTGPVTYLGPLPGEGGVVGVAASNRDNHWRVPGFHRGPESTISPTNILLIAPSHAFFLLLLLFLTVRRSVFACGNERR